MISTGALVLIAGASLATSFVSGILGMAGGMILMGVLLALLPVPAAMLLHGVSQLAANGWRALLLRREVDWPVARGFALGAVVALAGFAALRFVASKPTALILMGASTFAGLALPAQARLNVERRGHPFACGLICTAIAFTAGISGPILDLFFVHSKMGRHRVVATKATVQSLSHVLKIAYFGSLAAASTTVLPAWLAVAVICLAFAGTTLSRRVLDRMSDRSFRAWTRWTVGILGGVYLAMGLLAATR